MRVAVTALVWFFIIVSGQSFAQSQEEIFSRITPEQLASILAKDNREPKIEQSEGGERFVVYNRGEPWQGGQTIAIPLFCDEGGCAGFQLMCGFTGLRGAKLPNINNVNGNISFGRAYLSDDGTVFVMNYVYVEGGVTESNIISYVSAFDQVAAKVFSDLNR